LSQTICNPSKRDELQRHEIAARITL